MHQKIAKIFLGQILQDNQKHMQNIKSSEYENFAYTQTPRATVVMCSDSRVQTRAITSTDINDLFVVRNIGNQITNSYGSIEFGIKFLQTPVLLIIGHSDCGAVKAIINNTNIQSRAIQKEINKIQVCNASSLKNAILQNIHNQVKYSVQCFQELVNSQELTVVGAVYDFQNIYKQGLGKLIIVNINNNKDIDNSLLTL